MITSVIEYVRREEERRSKITREGREGMEEFRVGGLGRI